MAENFEENKDCCRRIQKVLKNIEHKKKENLFPRKTQEIEFNKKNLKIPHLENFLEENFIFFNFLRNFLDSQ